MIVDAEELEASRWENVVRLGRALGLTLPPERPTVKRSRQRLYRSILTAIAAGSPPTSRRR